MNSMGASALFVAFLVSLYGSIAALSGARGGKNNVVKSAEIAVLANLVLVTIASGALMRAFLARDFSLEYVYGYSSRSLSTAYTITAFWAGQEGSLLLWVWLLTACSSIAVYMNRDRMRDMMPWVIHILLVNSTFFLLLLNFVTNPFAKIAGSIPPDGYGLNPLLQNPGMIWHPPTLFVGYVGLTIPYAFALAALLADRRDSSWIDRTRVWTVISWFFLGIGILLGAWWAYMELGWGGYWAWDPVENASLLPWLTATAFMHSMMIQQRRGMFRMWNVSLVIFTYFLIIFGTFVTRSGVISSVHAFGKSSLGTFFLVYMIAMLAVSFGIVIKKRKLLRSDHHLEAIFSKETAFLLTNMIFAAMTFSVFWGTIFPAISELLVDRKIELGVGFYNRFNVPIAIVLMLLIGACPLLGWRRTGKDLMVRNFTVPVMLGMASGTAAWFLGVRNIWSFMVMALAGFIVGSIGMELYQGAMVRRRSFEEQFPLSIFTVIWSNRRRYGGYIVHLGMALIFMGLAGSPLTSEKNVTLKPEESVGIEGYDLRYQKMEWLPSTDRLAVTTRLKVFKDGEAIGYLKPERRFYERREDKPTTEVSVISSWKEDLYVALTGYNRDGRASFRVLVNPFVPWLWFAGYIVAIGTAIAIIPRRDNAASSKGPGGT